VLAEKPARAVFRVTGLDLRFPKPHTGRRAARLYGLLSRSWGHCQRAPDALQLAAAFTAAERRPASLQLVTLDDRLAEAARKEGFALVDIAAG
jgi:hypothetical protein